MMMSLVAMGTRSVGNKMLNQLQAQNLQLSTQKNVSILTKIFNLHFIIFIKLLLQTHLERDLERLLELLRLLLRERR